MSGSLTFGRFCADGMNRLLSRDGEPIAVTPKAFDTLWWLIDQRHRVVSKEELIEKVWAGAFVTEATLTQNIYTLRKVLDTGDGPRWIRTVPRRGYRFEGEVTSADAADGDPRAAPESPPPGEASIQSLAVLPLHALVPTPVPDGPLAPAAGEDERLLGLGLADAVITSLSNVRQLAVRATSSILRYVDVDERDPVAIGRELGVEGVLEGTVQRLGTRLRVRLQLVSVDRGVACWAESFQGSFRDLFAAQDAIAREIVSRLRVKLTRQEERQLAAPPTHNLEAYRVFVRGRYAWNQRTGDDLRRAIELFREAVALDPDYAQAYAGLADALILLPFYGAARPRDAFRQARDAARRALEIDHDLADAHTSLAYTDYVYSHDWQAAETGFERALACPGDYATAHHWYAFLLSALGRHDEAIHHATRALDLEPLSLVISTDAAMTQYFARREEEAVDHLMGVIEVAPGFGYAFFALALCLSALGRHAEAIEAARRACELLADSPVPRAALGFALARGGQPEAARQVFVDRSGTERLGSAHASQPQAAHRALVLIGLGKWDEALDALVDAREERSRFVALMAVWSIFDPLRGMPRFERLLADLGLPSGP